MRGRRGTGPAGLLGLLILAGSCAGTSEPSLDQVKQAAERYRDVRIAIAEGYTTDNKCVTAQMLGFPAAQGAMGLHYVRRDLLGLPDKPKGAVAGDGTYTDFAKPAMLVYEPQADGSLELVAVENLVFKTAWEAAGNDGPPTFRGNPYLLLANNPATLLDEAHGWEPHYELHAWVLRDNPLGTFKPFNPNVTCRHHKAAVVQLAHRGMHTARAKVESVDAASARGLLAKGALLVDVREPFELAQTGKLTGALSHPTSTFARRAASLPKDRPIILYCRSGRRSAIAGDILTSLGFTKVYNLGAFEAAAKAGLPTTAP